PRGSSRRASRSRCSPSWCRRVPPRRLAYQRMLLCRQGRCATAPAGITDALSQVAAAYQVGDPQVLQIEPIVLAHERRGWLVVGVASLRMHLLVSLGNLPPRLLAPFPPLLPAGKALLRLREPFLSSAVVVGMLDCHAVCGDEKHLQPHVDPRL